MNYRFLLLGEPTQTIVNCVGLLSSFSFFFLQQESMVNSALHCATLMLVDLIVLLYRIWNRSLDVGCCLAVIIEQALFRFELLHEKFSCGIRVSIQVL